MKIVNISSIVGGYGAGFLGRRKGGGGAEERWRRDGGVRRSERSEEE
jgi:hypothetical protein